MEKSMEPGRPLPVREYDPETDPVLASLRSHGSRGGGKKALAVLAVVGVLAAGGWYAYSVYGSRARQAQVDAELHEQVVPTPVPPTISPLQVAEEWCAENLAASEFAGLPVTQGGNGELFVVYTARSGDSIGSIVKRYAASFESEAPAEILESAKRQHVERYGGRGLWVSDEVRLLVPVEPRERETLQDDG
jgi:hypothetical protein